MAQKADNKIGERIAQSRKAASYHSQEAFAAALGVTRGAVSQWESGRKTPSLENVVKIARLCAVSIEHLYRAGETLHPGMIMEDVCKILWAHYLKAGFDARPWEELDLATKAAWMGFVANAIGFFGV